ncbi:hypothetical protein ACWEK5_50070 [Rhodococcus koreensis]
MAGIAVRHEGPTPMVITATSAIAPDEPPTPACEARSPSRIRPVLLLTPATGLPILTAVVATGSAGLAAATAVLTLGCVVLAALMI